jgi:hypothetical protein
LQFTGKRERKEDFNSKGENCRYDWDSILDNRANFSQKMAVWRAVIELRRGFKKYSNDVCVKALIQSNGNLQKATILLGTNDFVFNAQNSPQLGEEYKTLLNPFVEISEESNSYINTPSMSRRVHRYLPESNRVTISIKNPTDVDKLIIRNFFRKKLKNINITNTSSKL